MIHTRHAVIVMLSVDDERLDADDATRRLPEGNEENLQTSHKSRSVATAWSRLVWVVCVCVCFV